jgi:hypothetical protein
MISFQYDNFSTTQTTSKKSTVDFDLSYKLYQTNAENGRRTYSITPKEEPQRWLLFVGEASIAPARATAANCSSERPVYRGA